MSNNHKDSADLTPQIRRAAMDLLARREHSRRELLTKLGRRFNEESIPEALDGLERDGLLSDRRFCESYTRMRSEAGFGPLRLRAELRQRGVAEGVIAEVWDELPLDWWQVLCRLNEKKYRGQECADRRDMARRARFFQQRGFPPDLIGDLLHV